RDNLMNLGGFLLASGCILLITELYPASLAQLQKNERERDLVMKELEHGGRNTYAVIDAIIKKTFEDQPERAGTAHKGDRNALRWGPVRLHDQSRQNPAPRADADASDDPDATVLVWRSARSSDHNAASCPEVPLGRRHEYLAEAAS